MRARNPLAIMAKPPPEVQAQIAALLLGDPGRGTDLLHVTLISLYDLHHAPPDWLPARLKPWRRAGRLRCGPNRKIRLSYIIPPCFKPAGEQHPSLYGAPPFRSGPASDRHWAELS